MIFECRGPFWDWELTWDTEVHQNQPDFTECFELTVLAWIPLLFLLILTPLDIYYSNDQSKLIRATKTPLQKLRWTKLTILKTITSLCLIIIQGLYIIHHATQSNSEIYAPNVLTPAVRIVIYIVSIFLMYWARRQRVCSSGVQFLFWLLSAFCEAFTFRTVIRRGQDKFTLSYVAEILLFPFILLQLLLHCWADVNEQSESKNQKNNTPGKVPQSPCPEQRASFLSKLSFYWFESLGWKGYRKPLEETDLWDLNPEDKSDLLVPQFQKLWTTARLKSVTKSQKTGQPKKPVSILPILVKMFGPSFSFGILMKLTHDLLIFVSPEILKLLIGFVEGDESEWKGYLYTALLFIASVVQTLVLAQYFHRVFLIGMRIRTTLVSVIYQKALVMSNSSRKTSTVGEIVNLMSVDAQRFMDLMQFLNMIWSAPLQIIVALYFLWETLGPSVLAGLGVMILLIPINGFIVAKVRKLQVKQMKNKDERVKLMSEILSGIKVLKLYAWEPSFIEQVMGIRGKEVKVLKVSAYLFSTVAFIWSCTPFFVTIVTFATYVLSDENNILDAKKAFVSLTLFNIMRMPLAMLPNVVTSLVQASVSLKRLNDYMNADELDPDTVSHDKNGDDAVSIDKGSFGWDKETSNLKNISIQVKEGSLVAVVGTVGSGKSTLLAAILGELEKIGGKVNTKGKIAYVAQQAWIQNSTLKNNVLFGSSLDPYKYDRVIEACALLPDLDILPAGDSTEIGEKGINLSGGQKQRVSLARAAYNNADVYLLDDPLSAVDSHVGKHIFEHVIGPNGILKRKTRILVTHAITYLPHVDQIIVLKDGEVSEVGTYKELWSRKGAFADFLVQHIGKNGESIQNETDAEKVIRDLELEQVTGKQEILQRKMSSISQMQMDENKQMELVRRQSLKVKGEKEVKGKGKDKLIEKETAQTGNVKLGVYGSYMRAIGWNMLFWTFALHLANQGLSIYSNIWLSEWSEEGNIDKRDLYLGVYGALGVGQGITILFGSLALALGTLYGSSHLHAQMLNRVFRSPMEFFDVTPSGRIVNRFSKDVDTCDNIIPQSLRSLLVCLLSVLATIGVIISTTPIFAVVILPTGIVYVLVQRFYVATSRQLKRLESISRSPIYSQFSETLTGTTTIRAFQVQHNFIQMSESKVDQNQHAYFPSLAANRWLAVRLETVGNILILFAALFTVIGRETISPGLVGLSVSYALQITQTLNWLVRMSSDVETNIVAVERIKEYGELDQEAEWEIPEKKPPKGWPQNGSVVFNNYQTRYRSGLDLVLRNVTCQIKGGEKIGIVGRTGAGKSSLTLGLFRIVEAAGGSVEIDGENISRLGLHDVRGRLTIIPQDPVLFSGTLRMNLDPFVQYPDADIWRSLELSHLKSFVNGLEGQLDYVVSEGGENLSVGQRQLLCLARALLRKTKILVLDEATAAVDLETDDLIQQTIRTEFSDSTVLTIAHRLNTIMDYDRVMVLDKGQIHEFDSPPLLLNNTSSLFYGMAKDAGLVH